MIVTIRPEQAGVLLELKREAEYAERALNTAIRAATAGIVPDGSVVVRVELDGTVEVLDAPTD